MRTFLRFLAWIALLVGLLVGVARAFAIRWLKLPTDDPVFEGSLIPSLAGGDLILLQRLTKPRFGDLVLCPEPDYPSRYIIGRIVGEPGDEVHLKDGEVFVNGKPFAEERACDPGVIEYLNPNNQSEVVSQQCDWEAVGNHLHKVGAVRGHQPPPHDNSFEVLDGKLFLISDNRLFPYDSRDYGLVDIETCKETVFFRIVSEEGWMDSENRLDYIH